MSAPGTTPTEPCADAGTHIPRSPLDLDKLEEKLRGSGLVMVCRHPDIDGDSLDASTRNCVIDTGAPEQCEMSSGSRVAMERVIDKEHCPYWKLMARKSPTRLSIAEGLALIEAARATGPASPHAPQCSSREGQ